MRVSILSLLHFLIIKKKIPLFRLTQFSDGRRSKCTILSLPQGLRNFLTPIMQLSCRFYVFEQDTQFSYTETGNISDDFMSMDEWRHFFTAIGKFPDDFMSWARYANIIGWAFCIFRVPYKKKKLRVIPIDEARFLWSEKKNPKIAKNRPQKFREIDGLLFWSCKYLSLWQREAVWSL